MRYLPAVLLLLCTSCIQIGSDPQTIHYYLLESISEAPIIYSDKTLTIDIELIEFPDYLDRPQIVTHAELNTIKFTAAERWAEPVQDNLMRILRENLALILPAANISISPWEHSSATAVKIKLVINKFSAELGDHTEIDIRWKIRNGTGKTTQGHFTDQQPIDNSYRDLVAGLNSGIENLSLKLARELAGK